MVFETIRWIFRLWNCSKGDNDLPSQLALEDGFWLKMSSEQIDLTFSGLRYISSKQETLNIHFIFWNFWVNGCNPDILSFKEFDFFLKCFSFTQYNLSQQNIPSFPMFIDFPTQNRFNFLLHKNMIPSAAKTQFTALYFLPLTM